MFSERGKKLRTLILLAAWPLNCALDKQNHQLRRLAVKVVRLVSSMKSRVQLCTEILLTQSLYLQYHRFSEYCERFQTLTEWHWWRLTAAAERSLPEYLLWCPEKMHRMNRCLTSQFLNKTPKYCIEWTKL